MAVAIVKESATSVQVFLPGTQNDVWYKMGGVGPWSEYKGCGTVNVSVNISSVRYRWHTFPSLNIIHFF